MAYIYQLSLEIPLRRADEIDLGQSLQLVLGYLRTLLPNEEGYITTRAAASCCPEGETVTVLFQSEWDHWEDLEAHRAKGLEEKKVLEEFATDVSAQGLKIQILREVD